MNTTTTVSKARRAQARVSSLPASDLDAFRGTLSGDLIQPGDGAYDEARSLWNAVIDKYPALIARCATPDDVQASIQFARTHDLDIAVRGGGHNVAGSASCNGGLVIDLTPMREVRVDPDTRRAYAGGGATIGDLDGATQAYGLAAPMGVVTETGIAGLTLGGGFGWRHRKHGLSCDALRSVEVVTADGRVLHANPDEHADLFWAVRGGGGNFGVVTTFEYELHEIGPDVFFSVVIYPRSAAKTALQHVRAYAAEAPDAVGLIAFLGYVPAMDLIAASHHGEPCLFVVSLYDGPVEEGERELASLRTLAEPIADFSSPTPYLEVQQFFDEDYPSGGRYYWTSANLNGLDDDLIDRLIALNDEAPSKHSTLDIWLHGGAMSRVPAEATAFGDRSTPFKLGVEANWHDAADDDANIAWARRCRSAAQPFSDGSMYFNFPGMEAGAEERVRATYGVNYERLAAVKRAYDPDNLFRTHQNIAP